MQTEKHSPSRMDTSELKAQLFKKVGQERFKSYFHCLNRFINQKLSKSEFDKSCYRILGRDNLPLHNQIIRAILKNASSSKTPPPKAQEVDLANKAGVTGGKSLPVLEGGHCQGSILGPIWSNGVVPISPRKGRSTVRDRKLKDRPRPLGPNGKVNLASHQSTATNDIREKTLENGDLAPCDYGRPLNLPRGLAEQPEINDTRVIKKPGHVEDGEDAMLSRRPLVAPMGIPYFSASTSGTRKALRGTHIGDYVSCFDLGGLFDSEVLRRRMEQITAPQGLSVTLECANTLNNMVDVYLKRLIKSSLELVGSRSTSDTSAFPPQKQEMHIKPMNGLWPSNHLHIQNSSGAIEARRLSQSVSLLDFKVAMELNPQQLGENWPLLLEKISMEGFVE